MELKRTFDVSTIMNCPFHVEEVERCKSAVNPQYIDVGLIVDANNVMYRMAFAMSKEIATPEGLLCAFVEKVEAAAKVVTANVVVTCFDYGVSLRRSMMGARRKPDKTPEQEAVIQMAREALDLALGEERLNPRFVEGYEADDIAAAYALSSIFLRSVIYSTDSDLYQVTDGTMITQMSPANGAFLVSDMPPVLVAPAKALAGDTSDNIDGIAGVGPKTAISVLIGDKTISLTPTESRMVQDNILLTALPFPGAYQSLKLPLEPLHSSKLDDDYDYEEELPF